MGQTPDEIRREIEDTRNEMTETAQAIAHRVNVPSRVKGVVREKKEEWFSNSSASAAGGQAQRQVERIKSTVEEYPLASALGGLTLGFLTGRLFSRVKPHSRS